MTRLALRRPRWLRRPTKAGAVFLTVGLVFGIAGGYVTHAIVTPDPWSPLGPYSVQVVESQGPKLNSSDQSDRLIPQVKLGSKVHVTGVKCSSEEVTIKGEYGWRSVIPQGMDVPVTTAASGYRLPGCTPLDFRNDIPPAVDAWARSVIDNHKRPEVFIGGCEIPKKANGDSGVEVCWRTEPFVLVLPKE